MLRLALLGAVLCVVTLTAKATIHLELVDRIYLANANNKFKLGEGIVQRSVYSPVTNYIYAVGKLNYVFSVLDLRFSAFAKQL